MKPASFARKIARTLGRLVGPLLLTATSSLAVAATDLADQPLFTTISVPGNLILALSVEYPTANTSAYFSTTAYSSTTTFLGYFDSAKCYQYQYNSATPASSYFAPYSTAASSTCSSSSSLQLWSGNYLNWASMQSLDEFRWVLTGGNRLVDTSTQTILQKTYHSGQDGGGSAVNKKLPFASESGATPFNWIGGLNSRIWGSGIQMWITATGTLTNAPGSTTTTDWNGQNGYALFGNGVASASTIYGLYMNVLVCDQTVSVESNCVLYNGNSYKPEGLMQKYSGQLRYSAFGYLNDGNVLRDGGVMRAGMKYVGPTQPVPGSTAISNPLAEWSSATGIMGPNPNPVDAIATTTASASAGYSVSITQSGVMNYLNKFGYASSSYKQYDPVSEMYYAGIRYLKNLGNVASYSSLSSAGSTSTMKTWLDGFPVITNWTDPVVYSCQKNFVLGIGDENTHRDANLPGSTLHASGQEPAVPSEVTADTSVNVTTATNMVGQLEGISNLGTTYVSSGRYDTYFIAGLAYDSHTKDIRSDYSGMRVSTYWLDVLENQTYEYNNIYYLATKYGGFTVPSSFLPYATSNGTSTLTLTSWHNNADSESGGGTNLRPDNFYTANNADVMRTGLNSAFAQIASEASRQNSTAFAAPTPNVTTNGSVTYSATYDPSTWTGEVTASTVVYAANGTPALTQQWDARDLLSATTTTSATRKIVTCCTTSSAPGLPFTDASLTAASLISRTNYATFGNVPNALSQSKPNYLLYLRGDTSKEIQNGGAYRNRTFRLGDIVNSKPVAVSAPSSLFYDVYNPGYASFKTTYAGRKTVVYAGANDGMLHAFDGSVGATTSGTELFAYIPSFVYGTNSTGPTSGLASLGNPSFTHHYLVDATPGAFDANLNNTYQSASTTPDWHSLLIGGLGKGGTGYYALDVTDPSTWTSETAVASKVLWEFTDSRMGYTYGTPSVVKTKKYGWVVVMTSGYNNADGVGYFFFVNPKNGALLEAVATPTGSTSAPINLAEHSAYVADYHDMTADAIYAGDLQGNVWRLDVTAASGSYAAPVAIAKLTDPTGAVQPVTTRPLIEADPNSLVRYVLIGTGRLLADSDISSSQIQTFYSIADGTSTSGSFYTSSTLPSGVTFPVGRSKLNPVVNLTLGVTNSPVLPMGWYYDMPVAITIAQRVDVDPTADSGVVAWAGNLPNGVACSPAGTGTLYAASFASGKTALVDSAGNALGSYTFASAVAGTPATSSVITDLAFLSVAGTVRLYAGDSTGKVVVAPATISSTSGVKQLNWRDVPMNN